MNHDIKKSLDILNEMSAGGTSSGAIASVAQPMQTERRMNPSIYPEKKADGVCPCCGESPCAREEMDEASRKPPSAPEFSLWGNSTSSAKGEATKKHVRKKKSTNEQQLKSRLNRLIAERIAESQQLDELGNSLMPGGQRKLVLAKEADETTAPAQQKKSATAVDRLKSGVRALAQGVKDHRDARVNAKSDAERYASESVDEGIGDKIAGKAGDIKRWAKGKPTVDQAISAHNATARGALHRQEMFKNIDQPRLADINDRQANRERQKADRIAAKFGKQPAPVAEVITKTTSAGEIISDFEQSKDKRFAGKSKAQRKKQALGAYYGMHPEKSKKK